MKKLELLLEGSVKNILKDPHTGDFIFEYSDKFSVFDWGSMPDVLEGKGVALASMAHFFFEYLGEAKNWENWTLPNSLKELENKSLFKKFCKSGVPHHGVGLCEKNNQYKIKLSHVHKPLYMGEGQWDYSAYKKTPENTIVPLEVIFRFGIPKGSSLLKRSANLGYVKSLGLKTPPVVGETFNHPILEFSTKLEPSDRFVSYAEAMNIAGFSKKEFENLKNFVSLVAIRLKSIFENIDIELWDGKLEFAFGNKNEKGDRSFVLVDSIGPDELRLIYKGIQLSKETLRKFYYNSNWYKSMEKSKVLAREKGEKNWKSVCEKEFKIQPPSLDPVLKQTCEHMYKSLAQNLNKKFNFGNTKEVCLSLDQIVSNLTTSKGQQ